MSDDNNVFILYRHKLITRMLWSVFLSLPLVLIFLIGSDIWTRIIPALIIIFIFFSFTVGSTQLSIQNGVLSKSKFFKIFRSRVDLNSVKYIHLNLAMIFSSGATEQRITLIDIEGKKVTFWISFFYRTWTNQDDLIALIDSYGKKQNASYNKSALEKIRHSNLKWDNKYQISTIFEKRILVILAIIVIIILGLGVFIS